MFTDAFALRLFDPVKVQETGLKPVKGIILYGPPGTGKTTIARKLGDMLDCVTPIVKSGPELLNMYVGGGEKLIRELFEPAEKEWAEKGVHSRLHLIIIDEIDAIARSRGMNANSHTDSLVNQLLTKMDGVKEGAQSNFLIIAMTNRLTLIDKAFLRPGRFDLKLEIGLPNAEGRLQILNIHTDGLKKTGKIAPDVDLQQIAKNTNNYTGAEIEGIVRKAAARGLRRLVNPKTIDEEAPQWDGLTVTKQDFDGVISEFKPLFGIETALEKKPNIVSYGLSWESLLQDATRFVTQVRDSVPFFSVLIEGAPSTGKTTLARHIAKASGFPFLRVISPSNLAGKTEIQKAQCMTFPSTPAVCALLANSLLFSRYRRCHGRCLPRGAGYCLV
jgi:vesicle-fusing ATPase